MQSVLDSSEERKESILHKAFNGEPTEKWRKQNNIPRNAWIEVPKKYLENYDIELPDIDEQKEIVRLLDEFISKEMEIPDMSEQILTELDDNKKAMLSKVFHGDMAV